MEKPAADDATITSALISHIPSLRGYARRLARNRGDADDLVQDSLVRALSRLELFTPGSNLKGWLFSILHNIFVDGTRRSKQTRELVAAMTWMGESNVTRPNQFNRLELRDLDRALTALPATQRSIVFSIALDGRDYQETAKASGVPVGTVRSRLSRGRASLRDMTGGAIAQECL